MCNSYLFFATLSVVCRRQTELKTMSRTKSTMWDKLWFGQIVAFALTLLPLFVLLSSMPLWWRGRDLLFFVVWQTTACYVAVVIVILSTSHDGEWCFYEVCCCVEMSSHCVFLYVLVVLTAHRRFSRVRTLEVSRYWYLVLGVRRTQQGPLENLKFGFACVQQAGHRFVK